MVGRRCVLFPYTLSTCNVQQIIVHRAVVTRGFTAMPVAARLLHNACRSSLGTCGIFLNGTCRCIAHAGYFNLYSEELNLSNKDFSQ